MVTIEPFFYQKTTAFKERVQMINKINEIIEKINSGDIGLTEEQVREIITTELSDYYTKEEVDDAIDDIDLTPYATKTYVDNKIDSIDLTPYATNVRVDNEVETMNNTKQNVLTPILPVIIENDEIKLDTTQLLINNANFLNDFKIKLWGGGSAHKLLIEAGNSADSNVVSFDSYGMQITPHNGTVKTAGINAKLYSQYKGSGFIEFSGKLGGTSYAYTLWAMGLVANTDSLTWYAIGRDNSQTEFNGIFQNYTGSGRVIKIGTFMKDTNSKGHFDYTLEVNYSDKKVYICPDSTTKKEITVKADIPTGKVATDTVTFQDLIDMGFVNSP